MNETPEYPRCCLELESFSWYIGRVKAVSSALDGLWDQAGIFIDLDEKTIQQDFNNMPEFDTIINFNYNIADAIKPYSDVTVCCLRHQMRSTDQ